MKRGDVHAHASFPRRFVIVSTNPLTELGTVITAEIVDDAPTDGTFAMFAVTLNPHDDGVAGVVLGWRVNYTNALRLGPRAAQLNDTTMEHVDIALRAAMDL